MYAPAKTAARTAATRAGALPPIRQRHPRRLSVSMPEAVYRYLELRSSSEGRSMSNLVAFILEAAATAPAPKTGAQPISREWR